VISQTKHRLLVCWAIVNEKPFLLSHHSVRILSFVVFHMNLSSSFG
jgi:hypothetical protein